MPPPSAVGARQRGAQPCILATPVSAALGWHKVVGREFVTAHPKESAKLNVFEIKGVRNPTQAPATKLRQINNLQD